MAPETLSGKDIPDSIPNLPPKLPSTIETLQRAITWLGNRTKGELTDKPRRELVNLIGVYLSLEEATEWKQRLKQLVKQKRS